MRKVQVQVHRKKLSEINLNFSINYHDGLTQSVLTLMLRLRKLQNSQNAKQLN
jgi:hypothetical protein